MVSGAIDTHSSPDGVRHRVTVPITTTRTTIDAEPNAPHAEVTILPPDADPDTPGHQIDLSPGANTVAVTVTAQLQHGPPTPDSDSDSVNDNANDTEAGLGVIEQKQHTVTVQRGSPAPPPPRPVPAANPAIRHDPMLSRLAFGVQPVMVRSATSVELPKRGDTGTRSNQGDPASADASLAALVIGGVDFGAFSGGVNRYVVGVANGINEVTVTATPNNSDAEVDIFPNDADTTTSDVHEIELEVGANPIRVTVTSADMSTERIYTVQVNRSATADHGWDAVKDIDTLWGRSSGLRPYGLWSDGDLLWIGDADAGVINAYDSGGARMVERDIDVRGAVGRHDIAGIWSDGETIWAAVPAVDRLYGFDLATGQQQRSRDIDTLGAAGNSEAGGLWSDGVTMWVADSSADKVFAYDLASGQRRPADDIGPLSALNGDPAGIWSDGVTMWVADSADAKLYAYRLEVGTRIAARDVDALGGAGNLQPAGVWSDGLTLWVADSDARKVFAYRMAPIPALASLTFTDTDTDTDSDIDIGMFRVGTLRYTAHVPNTVTRATVTAEALHSAHIPDIDPDDADSIAPGHQVDLAPGTNTVTVAVSDGTDSRTYVATIVRAVFLSDDATLASLTLTDPDSDTLGIDGFNAAVHHYRASVPNPVSTVTVTAAASDADARVVISPDDADDNTGGHQIDIAQGAAVEIVITVTSPSGNTTRTYVIDAARFADNALSSLDITASNGTSVEFGRFDPERTRYRADVPLATRTVTVTATPANPDTEIHIDPPDRDTGTESHEVHLPANKVTTITVTATPSAGEPRTYTVHINRDAIAATRRQPHLDFDLYGVSSTSRVPASLTAHDGTLWLLNRIDHKAYALDLYSGARRAERDLNVRIRQNPGSYSLAFPQSLATDGATMWVTYGSEHDVFAFDLATSQLQPARHLRNLKFRTHGTSYGLWTDGEAMWVSRLQASQRVSAYDLATGAHRPATSLSEALLDSHGVGSPMGVWSDGDTIWVADSTDRKIYAFGLHGGDRRSHLDIDRLAAAGNRYPRGIWSDGNTMWVANAGSVGVFAYKMPPRVGLESLSVNGYDMRGQARPHVLAVPSGTTTAVVRAVPFDPAAAIAYAPEGTATAHGQLFDLHTGLNTITLTVTLDGLTNTYILEITRSEHAELSDEAALGALTLTDFYGAPFDIGFSPDDTSYDIDIASNVRLVTIAATPAEETAAVTIEPEDASPASADTHEIALTPGTTTDVTVTVTSSDLTNTQTYRIEVRSISEDHFARRPELDLYDLSNSGFVEGFESDTTRDLWSDGTTMWALNTRADRIYAYDMATGERTPDAEITGMRAAGNSNSTAIWSNGETMWVADYTDGKIYAYSMATGERTPDLDINDLGESVRLRVRSIWSDGTTLWTLSGYDNFNAFDLKTGERRQDREFAGPDSKTDGIWSDGTTMWFAIEYPGPKIFAYRLSDGARQEHLEAGSLAGLGANIYGIWSDGETLWVTDNDNLRYTAYRMPAARLSSLGLDGRALGGFDPDRRAYRSAVASDVSQATVSYTHPDHVVVSVVPDDADTDAEGHQVNLASGDNTVTVTAALDSQTAVYTLVITRLGAGADPADATLASLEFEGIDFGTFDPAVTRYEVFVDSGVDATTVVAAPAEDAATAAVAPDDADGDADGHQVDLAEGANTITVTVVSADGFAAERYEVVVHRAAVPPEPSDTALGSLSLSGISVEFDPGAQTYHLDAPATLESTTISVSTRDAGATATIAGTATAADGYIADLAEGFNEIAITVTAANGDQRTITLRIGRGTKGIYMAHRDIAAALDGSSFNEPSWTQRTLSDGIDYFSFTLSSNRGVGLGLRRFDIDLDLYLENGQGVVIASSTTSGADGDNRQHWEWLSANLAAGTYYIRVQGAQTGTTDYILRIGP